MELIDPARYLAAILFTLGLLFVAWYLARKYGPTMSRTASAGQPRMQVLESLDLDGRRRLVRVQDGDMEHLILLGGMSGDLHIHSNPASLQQNEAKKVET